MIRRERKRQPKSDVFKQTDQMQSMSHTPKPRSQKVLSVLRAKYFLMNGCLYVSATNRLHATKPNSGGRSLVKVRDENGKLISMFRSHVVWYLHTKKWPTALLDHVDRNPTNDHVDNLRESTSALNMRNTKVQNPNGLGVKLFRGRYVGSAQFNGKRMWTRAFSTPQEAQEATNALRQQMGALPVNYQQAQTTD